MYGLKIPINAIFPKLFKFPVVIKIIATLFQQLFLFQVKQLAEQKVGILTQTIKEETIRKGLKSRVIKSIILKVNSKLMGVNHALHSWTLPYCLQEPHLVMLVGGHVIHPTPQQVIFF